MIAGDLRPLALPVDRDRVEGQEKEKSPTVNGMETVRLLFVTFRKRFGLAIAGKKF
jgi:hypothetical protein